MGTFDLILAVFAGAFIVLLILLFEKKRARQIERDLREQVTRPPGVTGGTDPPAGPDNRPAPRTEDRDDNNHSG